MSDRQSAAADITQAEQSRHRLRENKHAPLILKRKRLRSKRAGSIFFTWGTFSFCMVSEYRMHCRISVPLQLSCPSSNLLWFMWLRSYFQPAIWPWKECMCFIAKESASLTCSYSSPTGTHTGHENRNGIDKNVFDNWLWIQIIGQSNNKYWTQLHKTVWLLSQTFVKQETVFLNKSFRFDDPVTCPIIISECDWFPSGKRRKRGKWWGSSVLWQDELLFFTT